MKRWFGVAAGIAFVSVLAGTAFAQMGSGQQTGPGSCPGMGSGMGWTQMGPGMMGPGMGWGGHMGPGMMGAGATQVTEEKAKELAQQYADAYLKGFTVEKVLPFTTGMGMTMYSAELKGPQDDLRTLHVTPWGNVMPYGGRWRRSG